ncbi:AAA family ATPase [Streptomyces sp. NPDC001414]
MDPRLSPYSPQAGARPLVLAGREQLLERFEVVLDRLQVGRSADAPLITGARGSGKTVLFNTMVKAARDRGWFVSAEEAIPDIGLSTLIALMARDVLLEMSGRHRAADRVKRALGILKAFVAVSVVGVRLEINAEAISGTADTGILDLDLRRLMIEIGEIAQLQDTGVLFGIDEVHVIPQESLGAMNSAMHAAAQRALPVAFLGAGLFPSWQASGLQAEDPTATSTYVGRNETLSYVRLEPLTRDQSRRALAEPALREGVSYTDDALDAVVDFCEGSPWLLQAVGEAAWEWAPASPIDMPAVGRSLQEVQARLHEMYFPRLLRGCTESELRVLAMVAAARGQALRVQSLLELDSETNAARHVLRSLAIRNLIKLHNEQAITEGREFTISLAVPRLAAYL